MIMGNITQYIDEYGDYSFEEKAFNDIDALIFSQLSYIDYSAIAGKFDSEITISLKEASTEYFNLYEPEELKKRISIVVKAGKLLAQCAEKKRYGDIQLLKYANNINDKIDKQFSAINFYLNDSLAVIAYRGTDTSITGIKESAMLSYMFPVPAQIEALYYLQECGLIAKRDIIVCGHSKGGNLATFAGVNCSNSLKKRILKIYEFDAPGFPKQMIESYNYKEMEDKIFSFIPQTSIIGCMLYHDSARKIVESSNENLKQHQVDSWQINGDKFVYNDETDDMSKFIDKYLKLLLDVVGEENTEDVFEIIFDFIEDTGITKYEDIKTFDISRLIKAIVSLKEFDDEKKDLIENTIRQAIKEFSHLIYKEKFTNLAKHYPLFDNK